MVRRIANFHRIPWTQEGKLIYRLLFRLERNQDSYTHAREESLG